jgi:GxxExxY protein
MKTDSIPAALNPLTKRFIGCVIEVHRQLGPGLRKSTCEAALAIELEPAGIRFTRQAIHPATYKGREIAAHRLDLLVEEAIVVELKSVERHDPLFEARLLTYLRISGKRDGLLMNFNPRLLEDGIKRMTL